MKNYKKIVFFVFLLISGVLLFLTFTKKNKSRIQYFKNFKQANLSKKISGEFKYSPDNFETISFQFVNLKGRIRNNYNNKLIYNCSYNSEATKPIITKTLLDFTKTKGANCRIKIPVKHKITFNVVNTNLRLDNLNNDIDVNFVNGKVKFEADDQANYKYNLNLVNGRISESFKNSTNTKSFQINITGTNGVITN